ncbi:hypothetical protein MVEN_01563800 [Mycena venus]|uniref:Uncharacterized protein n=1 Tax=Mycena venus TaxID=2733690 RepID=A0A8H6XS55_9AGAR|nr:hypothetical protein MVEN_01563800 [Mycena venus]
MNRGPSPIFDVPEFPTLRRVKPLPKRRRTGAATPPDGDDATAALPSLAALGLPFPLPGPDATAEELIAHAESLSAHMALQSYYMPGLQDIFSRSAELAGAANGNANLGLGLGSNNHLNLNGNYGEDDGEDGDDDGMEHLQQPGNTKKRKVPATNASASPTGHDRDAGDPALSGGEDDSAADRDGRGVPTGRNSSDDGGGAVDVYQPPSGSPFAGLGIRKGRPPPITLAGLQHKETLKSRKRQLAAVLGALSHGDTLALDQALSANYPFVGGAAAGLENVPPPARPHLPPARPAPRTRGTLLGEIPPPGQVRLYGVRVHVCGPQLDGGTADRDEGGGHDAAGAVRGGAREAGGEGGEVGGSEQAHGVSPRHGQVQ